MIPNSVQSQATGVDTNGNDLIEAPGKFAVADNVVFNRDNMPERRRGYENDSLNIPSGYTPAQLLANASQTQAYMHLDNGLWYRDSATGGWLRKRYSSSAGAVGPVAVCVIGSTAYMTTRASTVVSLSLTSGLFTVIAGASGTSGATDATGSSARFGTALTGIATDGTNLYVCDQTNFAIRKIVISSGVVTTIGGVLSSSGTADGAFGVGKTTAPSDIVYNSSNSLLYFTDGHAVRSCSLSGTLATISGAVGASGVTDNVTGATARFSSPRGLAVANGAIYVCDYSNSAIRKVDIATTSTSTVAGIIGTAGDIDGGLGTSRVRTPLGMWFDGNATIYFTTISNGAAASRLRTLNTSSNSVATLLSGSSQADGASGTGGLAGNTIMTDKYGVRLFGAGNNELVLADCDICAVRVFYIDVAGLYTLHGGFSAFFSIKTPDRLATAALTSSQRVRMAETLGNSYFTSSTGIRKSTSASASLTQAGMVPGLDFITANNAAGTTLANNKSRAYRVLFGYRDANNLVVVGRPSGRVVHTNTSGAAKSVNLTVYIPPDFVVGSYFVQVYATAIVDSTIDPGDQMSLIAETAPDYASAIPITITDNVPDSFRMDAIYTDEAEEGIAQQNDPMPAAKDVCVFRNRLVLANLTDPHRVEMQMLGTESIVAASTITIGGVVYTARAAPAVAGEFKVYSAALGTGLGTQALNVDATAKSLVQAVNGNPANGSIYAFYVSGVDDAPGAITLEARLVGSPSFSVSSNLSGAFILTTSLNSASSIAQSTPNGLRVSKYNEPESMPVTNTILVGSSDDAIQRVLPLRDSMIVIKQRSIWRLIDSDPSAEPALLDNTCSCAGADTFAVLNNSVIGLSNQGFIGITDNGVQIIGRPEEHRVLAGIEERYSNTADFVGTGIEAQRMYLCRAYDAAADKAVVYSFNALTRAWSRHIHKPSAMTVVNDRVMMALDSTRGIVMTQRASRRNSQPFYYDNCDESSTVLISAVVGTTVTCTWTQTINYDGYLDDAGSDSIQPGFVILDGSNQFLVTAASVNAGTWTLTVNNTGLGTGSKTIYRSIPVTLEWAPIVAGNPGELKQFQGVTLKAETQDAYGFSFDYFNEDDQRDDPASTTYSSTLAAPRRARPATDLVTLNDFSTTRGKVSPWKSIVSAVNPLRAEGQHLSVRIKNAVAFSRVAIKSLIVQTRRIDSNKANQ